MRLRHAARVLAPTVAADIAGMHPTCLTPSAIPAAYAGFTIPSTSSAYNPNWAQRMMSAQTQAVVERRRRFQGRMFRLWVEDCMVRGGIRVHAFDTVSLTETHTDFSDAVVQRMFDNYWECVRRIRESYGMSGAPTTDAEHSAELREFLGCLLDSAHFELNDEGNALALRVPTAVEPRDPISGSPRLSQAWREDQTRDPLTKTWIKTNIWHQQPLRARSRCETRPASANSRIGVARVTSRSRPESARMPNSHHAPTRSTAQSDRGKTLNSRSDDAGPRLRVGGPGSVQSDRFLNVESRCTAGRRPAGPVPKFRRKVRPSSARGISGERHQEAMAETLKTKTVEEDDWPHWTLEDVDQAGTQPRTRNLRQHRPVSAKALKHKRVPDENTDGPTIYEDREPSVDDGKSERDASVSARSSVIVTVSPGPHDFNVNQEEIVDCKKVGIQRGETFDSSPEVICDLKIRTDEASTRIPPPCRRTVPHASTQPRSTTTRLGTAFSSFPSEPHCSTPPQRYRPTKR